MNTQNKRLSTSLQAGQVIDPMYALSNLGIYRLASRIHDLRKQGYQINKSTRKVFNRFGEASRPAVYWMTKE